MFVIQIPWSEAGTGPSQFGEHALELNHDIPLRIFEGHADSSFRIAVGGKFETICCHPSSLGRLLIEFVLPFVCPLPRVFNSKVETGTPVRKTFEMISEMSRLIQFDWFELYGAATTPLY